MESHVDRFLPHQGRMKLVDTLIACDPDQKTGEVRLRLKADAPYFVRQVFQSHWLIEIMAQTGAVLSHVLRAREGEGEATPGFLIAIRSFSRLDQRPLAPGDGLRARAQFDGDMDILGQCSGSVFLEDGTLIAEAVMTFLSNASGEF